MKKLFAIILCAAALVGCSYGEGGENNTPATENMVMVTLTADNGSRTYIDGQKGLWSEGDKIQLVVDGAKAGALTLIEGAGTTKATFRGPISITEDYAKEYSVSAYYPADADVTVGSNNVLTYNLDVENSNGAEGFMYTNLTTSNLVKDVENKQIVMTIDNFTFYRTMAVVKVVNNNTEVTSYAGAKFVSTTAVFGQTATIDPANGSNGITWSNLTNEVGVKGSSNLYIGVPAYSADGTHLTASLFDGNNKDVASKVIACNSLVRNNLYTVTFTTPTPEVNPLITLPSMSGIKDAFRPNSYTGGMGDLGNLAIAGNWAIASHTSGGYTIRGLNCYFDPSNENPDVIKLDNTQKRVEYGSTGLLNRANAYNQACLYYPIEMIAGTYDASSTKNVLLTFDAFVLYSATEGTSDKLSPAPLYIRGHKDEQWESSDYDAVKEYYTAYVNNEGVEASQAAGKSYVDDLWVPEVTSTYWQSYSIKIENFDPNYVYFGFAVDGNSKKVCSVLGIRNVTMQFVN